MAYLTIPTDIIESGDPVTSTLWSVYVRDNFEDHEARILSLEAGGAMTYVPFFFEVHGCLKTREEVGLIRINFAIKLLAARLLIKKAGTGGATTIDFQYKRGSGVWTSIFSTKPSVTATSDYAISNNAVLSTVNLLSGDLLRMNIDSVQSGDPKGLLGILEFEKT